MFGGQGREENGPWCESLPEVRQNETPLRSVEERGFLRRAGGLLNSRLYFLGVLHFLDVLLLVSHHFCGELAELGMLPFCFS